MEELLRTEKITKVFKNNGNESRALSYVNFSISTNETVGICGESGSGKTTLGEILNGIIEPSYGKVFYKSKDIKSLNKLELREYRKNVSHIFQDVKASMNPYHNIKKILSEPVLSLDINLHGESLEDCIHRMLEKVKLPTSILERYPKSLSGGEAQRVSIARSLITRPEIIIADEPFSALDALVSYEIANLLKDIQKSNSLSLVLITHDLSLLNYLCEDILVLDRGLVAEMGKTKELIKNPKSKTMKTLIENY